MADERNLETRDALKREIKALQTDCLITCHAIENVNSNKAAFASKEVTEEVNNCFIRGLQAEIQNSNTPISTDVNLFTSQFLSEIKEKAAQIDELKAYTKGVVHDLDAENSRLKNLISIAKEAQAKPKIKRQEIHPEQLQKAKKRFQIMKTEVMGLLQALFPQSREAIGELLGELLAAKLENNSYGYVPVTSDNFQLIQQLKELKIVTINPYSNMHVKLNF